MFYLPWAWTSKELSGYELTEGYHIPGVLDLGGGFPTKIDRKKLTSLEDLVELPFPV